MSEIEAGTAREPLAHSGEREFGVAPSTYFVVGFVSIMPLVIGIGLYGEGHAVWGIACVLLAPLVFVHFCFQKIAFATGTMALRRPFLPDKSVALANVTAVRVTLMSLRGRPLWQCVMNGGEMLLIKFNPKLFSLEALDYMFDAVRMYSPNASISDDTRDFRPKPKG
jgi:hypothetical protein